MNYLQIYKSFIVSRRKIQDDLEVYEKHHVQPRCLGGSNDPENLIKLSPGDHLFAHVLLAKLYKGPLSLAVMLMLECGKYQGRMSRVLYESLKQDFKKHQSERMTGVSRGPHSPEHSAKISASAIKRGQRVQFTEDSLKRIGVSSAERLQDPRYKEPLDAGREAFHADPVKKEQFKKKMKAVCSTPEARARLDRARAIRWAKAKSEVVE